MFKKICIILAFVLCFSIVCFADDTVDNFVDENLINEFEVTLPNDDVVEDFLSDSDSELGEEFVPSPAPSSPDIQEPFPADNTLLISAIDGLSQSLTTNQSSSVDYMSLVPALEENGFYVDTLTSDFCVLYYSLTNSYIFVTHSTIFNLGVMY